MVIDVQVKITDTEILTDDEIKFLINATEHKIEGLMTELRFYKNLLKLNQKGREEALIYMFGLTQLEKYTRQQTCCPIIRT